MGDPDEFDDRDVCGLWCMGLVRLFRQNPHGRTGVPEESRIQQCEIRLGSPRQWRRQRLENRGASSPSGASRTDRKHDRS